MTFDAEQFERWRTDLAQKSNQLGRMEGAALAALWRLRRGQNIEAARHLALGLRQVDPEDGMGWVSEAERIVEELELGRELSSLLDEQDALDT